MPEPFLHPAPVNYISAINRILIETALLHPDLVQMGENINKGSCIGGMTRNLPGRVLNIGNCENTHCGVGFGMMLNGASLALYVKQLDFLLLGLDQIVNTYNLIRCQGQSQALGSFTIVVIVCDQGMQGPQSSCNTLADLCSLARVDGYTLTNLAEARHLLGQYLVRPGFRIIALSQRLFHSPVLDPEILYTSPNGGMIQYSDGPDLAIVCFNFSLPQGLRLAAECGRARLSTRLFSAHPVLPHAWDMAVEAARSTGRLVAIDDGKGVNSIAYLLAEEVRRRAPHCQVTVLTRPEVSWTVGADRFEIDYQALVEAVRV